MGIKDFAFKSQHHLVIYFKTDGIDISDDPLWFGDMLQGEVLQHSNADYQANPNYSFYGAAKTKTTIAGNWPKNILYVRNHYQKRGQYGHGYAPLDPPDVRLYSMNVNLITTAEPGGLTLPLIFDPDTGNMGTGQP
jgi:hypothetical protein